MATRRKRTNVDGKVTVRSKAANGEGSVYQEVVTRRQDGTEKTIWRATYWVAGEKRPRRARGRTRADAIKARDEAVEKLNRARPSSFTEATTVGELAAWWLENVASHRGRASSQGTARTNLAPGRLVGLAGMPVVDVGPETLIEWQHRLLEGAEGVAPLKPKSVVGSRIMLRQVFEQAVESELIDRNPFTKIVRAPKVDQRPGRHLEPEDARRLVAACSTTRYGAAVALLFVQGWRVSEALGLAWSDIDFEAGTATVRRAVVQIKGQGRQLGLPKTEGAEGVHQLAPGVVERLRRRRTEQLEERLAAGPLWQTHEYEGRPIELVFTTEDGGLAARQSIDKLIRRKAEELGIDSTKLGTHAGRRSVVTALYLAGEDLEDIARHVGHRSTSTTAGYVASLGERPKRTAATAAQLLDGPS